MKELNDPLRGLSTLLPLGPKKSAEGAVDFSEARSDDFGVELHEESNQDIIGMKTGLHGLNAWSVAETTEAGPERDYREVPGSLPQNATNTNLENRVIQDGLSCYSEIIVVGGRLGVRVGPFGEKTVPIPGAKCRPRSKEGEAEFRYSSKDGGADFFVERG